MNIFQELLKVLPVLAGMKTDNKTVDLAIKLGQIAAAEIQRRMDATGKTRDEVLAEASATWDEAIKGADDLLAMGHTVSLPNTTEDPE